MGELLFDTLFPYINLTVLVLCIISLVSNHFLKQGKDKSEMHNRWARVFGGIRMFIAVICVFFFTYLIAMGVYFLLKSF